jgi:hypothetical protein
MSGSGGGGTWRPEPKPAPGRKGGAGGGGSGTSGGGGGVSPPDPCNIIETTSLNSVVRTVLTTLRVGDVLDVVFIAGPPQRLVAQAAGGIAGSITSPSMPQIIRCITQGGHSYEAEILSIKGALCQVQVRPR